LSDELRQAVELVNRQFRGAYAEDMSDVIPYTRMDAVPHSYARIFESVLLAHYCPRGSQRVSNLRCYTDPATGKVEFLLETAAEEGRQESRTTHTYLEYADRLAHLVGATMSVEWRESGGMLATTISIHTKTQYHTNE